MQLIIRVDFYLKKSINGAEIEICDLSTQIFICFEAVHSLQDLANLMATQFRALLNQLEPFFSRSISPTASNWSADLTLWPKTTNRFTPEPEKSP